jgi:uncharacterized protein involved in exopolysaccharide biosynthesis
MKSSPGSGGPALTNVRNFQLQELLREQSQLQRELDEVRQMLFHAAMEVRLMEAQSHECWMILEPASFPEGPELPARHHILLGGIALALIIAIPAAFMRKQVPKDAAKAAC